MSNYFLLVSCLFFFSILLQSFDLGETWTEPQEMNKDTLEQMKPVPSLYAPGVYASFV